MRSVNVIMLLPFVVHAQVVSRTADAEDAMGIFAGKLVDELADRALKAWPAHYTDLENVMFRKQGHLTLPSGKQGLGKHNPGILGKQGHLTLPSGKHDPGVLHTPKGMSFLHPIHNGWQELRHNNKVDLHHIHDDMVEFLHHIHDPEPKIHFQADPEEVRHTQHKFMLGAPSIFKPYFPGFGYRETKAYTIIPKKIWGFEQSMELISLSVNVRCTVIRLKSGGLWVHAPVFPTDEFLAQLDELGGEVEHIVLPTYALEHKLPMAPFIRRVRERAKQKKCRMPTVWTVPDTWSFPVDLPLRWLGIRIDGVLGQKEPPWQDEIEFKILRIADVGKPFIEAVFFHRHTRTLIVTDTVYEVPRQPPEVTPTALMLDVAPDDPTKPLPDTPRTRQQAWAKMALLVAFFIPARQRLVEGGKAEWQEGYMNSFEMIAGHLLVSPILQKLVFEKSQSVVRDWVEDVSKWPFTQVVPAHYAAPVRATPKDLRRAFGFAFGSETNALPQEDMKTLNDLGEIVKASSSGESEKVYSLLFDKFFKNLFLEKSGWLAPKIGKDPEQKQQLSPL